MTREELEVIILEEIENLAPEAALDGLAPSADLRDALDLDSMDIMNLVIALHERLRVDIPDADAPQLTTLEGGVGFLAEKLGID